MQMGNCPACGSEMSGLYDPKRGARTSVDVGDFGVCMHCYTILVFARNGLAKVASSVELALMPVNVREAMLSLRARLEREGVGGERKDKHVRQARSGEAGYARVERGPAPNLDAGYDQNSPWVQSVWADRRLYEASGGKFREMTDAGIVAFCSDPTKLVLICEKTRKGIHAFMHALEHEVFPPRTPLNAALELHPLTWQTLDWAVLLIPMAAKSEAERIASLSGMRLVSGVPFICIPGGTQNMGIVGNTRPGSPSAQEFARRGRVVWFPIKGDNAFAVENAPGCTPPERQEEQALCNFIVSEWEAKYPKKAG